MNKKIIIAGVLSFISLPVLADSWPTFTYPDVQQLLSMNYLDTKDCPSGQGKLIPNVSINISKNNCRGWCPTEWAWVAIKTDGLCHPISDLEFKSYHFSYFPNTFEWDYSVVTASYGSKKSDQIYFELELKTLPIEYWYCTKFTPEPRYVTCANDF